MPAWYHSFTASLLVIKSCTDTGKNPAVIRPHPPAELIEETIRGISLPQGFHYVEDGDTSYANWLLDLSLKENKTVYLHNGKLKPDQSVQYGVLDIDIGKKDLVQCADAVMKLRADYLYEQYQYSELNFVTTSGDSISFQDWLRGIRWKEQRHRLIPYKIAKRVTDIRYEYNGFMDVAFSYCGSYSLSNQLKSITDINSIRPGDVFIKGGFPGHAVTVMAVARNDTGKCLFLLSQGYMPAQDIHILKNYRDPELSPWYKLGDIYPLYTPQWQFEAGSLKRW